MGGQSAALPAVRGRLRLLGRRAGAFPPARDHVGAGALPELRAGSRPVPSAQERSSILRLTARPVSSEPTFARRRANPILRVLLRVPVVVYRGPIADLLRSRCVLLLTTRGGRGRVGARARLVEDPERRRGLMLQMQARAAGCGPPRPVRPLLKLARVFDYEAEISMAVAAGPA